VLIKLYFCFRLALILFVIFLDFGRMSFMDMNFDTRNRFLIQKYSKNVFDEEPVIKHKSSSSKSEKPIYDKYVNGRSLDNINRNSNLIGTSQHQPIVSSHAKSSSNKKQQNTSKMSNLMAEQRKTGEQLLRVKKEADKQASDRVSAKSGVPMKGIRSSSAVPFNYPFVVASPLNEIDPNIIEKQKMQHRANVMTKPVVAKQWATRLHFQPRVLLPQPPMQQQAYLRISPVHQSPMFATNGNNFVEHPTNGYHSHVNTEHYSPSGQYGTLSQHQKYIEVYFVFI
jgi:hypothetical protein